MVEEAKSVDEADEKVEEDVDDKVVKDELEYVALPLCQKAECSPESLGSVIVPIEIYILALAGTVKTESLLILIRSVRIVA